MTKGSARNTIFDLLAPDMGNAMKRLDNRRKSTLLQTSVLALVLSSCASTSEFRADTIEYSGYVEHGNTRVVTSVTWLGVNSDLKLADLALVVQSSEARPLVFRLWASPPRPTEYSSQFVCDQTQVYSVLEKAAVHVSTQVVLADVEKAYLDIVAIPDGLQGKFVYRASLRDQLVLRFLFPQGNATCLHWLTDTIGTLVHEYMHVVYDLEQRIFPNLTSEEAYAYAAESCSLLLIGLDPFERATKFKFDDEALASNDMYEQLASEAQKLGSANESTIAGKILSDFHFWLILGQTYSTDLSGTQRTEILDFCNAITKTSIDVTNSMLCPAAADGCATFLPKRLLK